MKWLRPFLAVTLLAVVWPQGAEAQNQPPAAAAPDDDPDLDPNRNQPDFTLVNLPTTLRVPRYKSAFRVTHRFGRPLGAGYDAEWSPQAIALASIASAFLEPDPEVDWDAERIATVRETIASGRLAAG